MVDMEKSVADSKKGKSDEPPKDKLLDQQFRETLIKEFAGLGKENLPTQIRLPVQNIQTPQIRDILSEDQESSAARRHIVGYEGNVIPGVSASYQYIDKNRSNSGIRVKIDKSAFERAKSDIEAHIEKAKAKKPEITLTVEYDDRGFAVVGGGAYQELSGFMMETLKGIGEKLKSYTS
jgi:hypothetical protein